MFKFKLFIYSKDLLNLNIKDKIFKILENKLEA